jgi:nicotinamide-nucleotide amidase
VNAEIIAIGSELLTPFRQDTNSLHLTAKLNELGVEVDFKDVVGDRRSDLIQTARIALSRADIVIFMGGLGPTEDDLTREAVAEALGTKLHRDSDISSALVTWFASRRVKMPENNFKQADVLAGAQVLRNPRGTAPGQFLQTEFEGHTKIIMLLPGPPREILPMFDEQCMDRLRKLVPPQFIATRVLKLAMIGEGDADRRAAPIYTKQEGVQTTILANTGGEIQLHLRAQAEDREAAQKKVDKLASLLEDEFGDIVFSAQGESLEQIVGYYLQMHGLTLAAAESCTGGMISQRITSVPGSSRYFLGGAIVYDNSLKSALADVPPLMIAEYGAVSREVAGALAEGIRKRCNASLGIGITGVAGPGGGTEQKPVGLVYHALADSNGTEVIERRFPGERDRVRYWASQQALDMVRRKLME